ncbi:MAG: hypothetical protein JWR14_7668 [Caballeronia sp.]|nr:hypothetical protein [Caballeronia sp.]
MKGTVRGAYATFGTPRLGSSAWRIQDARSADPLTLTREEPPVFLFANAFGNAFGNALTGGHPLPMNPVAMTIRG